MYIIEMRLATFLLVTFWKRRIMLNWSFVLVFLCLEAGRPTTWWDTTSQVMSTFFTQVSTCNLFKWHVFDLNGRCMCLCVLGEGKGGFVGANDHAQKWWIVILLPASFPLTRRQLYLEDAFLGSCFWWHGGGWPNSEDYLTGGMQVSLLSVVIMTKSVPFEVTWIELLCKICPC